MNIFYLLLLSFSLCAMDAQKEMAPATTSLQTTIVTFDQVTNRLTIEGAAVIKVVGNQVEIKTPDKEPVQDKKCRII